MDSKSGVITVTGKGQKQRHVYLSAPSLAALNIYLADGRPSPVADDTLFLTEDGYPLKGDRVAKILERIGKKACTSKRLSAHKLRHSFATSSLRHGANLAYVQRSLGHSQIRTTEGYLALVDADVEQAHRQFSPVANLKVKPSASLRKVPKFYVAGQPEPFCHSWEQPVPLPPNHPMFKTSY